MILVVEVMNSAGSAWDEVSRYDADRIYISGRRGEPKEITGREIAAQDERSYAENYRRAVRIREVE